MFWKIIPECQFVGGSMIIPPAHNSKVVKSKLEELDGIELLPHPAYIIGRNILPGTTNIP